MAAQGFPSLKDMKKCSASSNQEEDQLTKMFGDLVLKETHFSPSYPSAKKINLFPPPISCFQLFKKGKPYIYLEPADDENHGTFVVQEIRIPAGDMLRAYRENGRLRLYFVHHDQEEEEEYEFISHDEVDHGKP